MRWDQLRREFPDNSMGWVELAKYHEHVTRDVNRALDLVQRCPHQQTDELQLRLQRLRRRVQQLGTTAGDAPNLLTTAGDAPNLLTICLRDFKQLADET